MIGDTIAAVSTALQQDSAISIVRLSGEDAIEIVNSCFTKDLSKVDSHTIHYGFIIDNEEKIDEVLVNVFRAPKTYTKEDIVEVNCHGGRLVTRRVLSLLLSKGARLAEPGEFTQRAFLNGRIDLSQAESINDLINANSLSNTKIAMSGISGSITKLINPLIQQMLDLIANIEVNIDYPEYDDVLELTNQLVLPIALDIKEKLKSILKKAESGRILRQGVKTVILGKPNVGKSSLLNALLEEDKAIVTDIEGTTRDFVEGIINLENVTLHLIDTAGLRETENVVEQIGINKAYQALDEAELVIVVLDGSKDLDDNDYHLLEITEDKNRLVVVNKADLKAISNFDDVASIEVSAINKEVDNLTQTINNRYQEHQFALYEPTLNNDRQISLMKRALDSINAAISSLESGSELDIVTIDFQDAYLALCEILGKVSKDDLLETMFSQFCLGK